MTPQERHLEDCDASLFTAALMLVRALDDPFTTYDTVKLRREALQDAACEYAVASADYHDQVGCHHDASRHQVVKGAKPPDPH